MTRWSLRVNLDRCCQTRLRLQDAWRSFVAPLPAIVGTSQFNFLTPIMKSHLNSVPNPAVVLFAEGSSDFMSVWGTKANYLSAVDFFVPEGDDLVLLFGTLDAVFSTGYGQWESRCFRVTMGGELQAFAYSHGSIFCSFRGSCLSLASFYSLGIG